MNLRARLRKSLNVTYTLSTMNSSKRKKGWPFLNELQTNKVSF